MVKRAIKPWVDHSRKVAVGLCELTKQQLDKRLEYVENDTMDISIPNAKTVISDLKLNAEIILGNADTDQTPPAST